MVQYYIPNIDECSFDEFNIQYIIEKHFKTGMNINEFWIQTFIYYVHWKFHIFLFVKDEKEEANGCKIQGYRECGFYASLIRDVILKGHTSKEDSFLPNILIHRYLSREEIMKEVGYITDIESFIEYMQGRKLRAETVAAKDISCISWENRVKLWRDIWDRRKEVWEMIYKRSNEVKSKDHVPDTEDAYLGITSINQIGVFNGWQMTCDLLMMNMIKLQNFYHAKIGPGPKKVLLKMNVKIPQFNDFVDLVNEHLNKELFKDHKKLRGLDIDDILCSFIGKVTLYEKSFKFLKKGYVMRYDDIFIKNEFENVSKRIQTKLNDRKRNIFGVLPYMAPEVLKGKPYTHASDIYSFSMIMWEITTGLPPFYDKAHDFEFILDICLGERPKIPKNVPSKYIDLMERCWDSNPSNRPTAEKVQKIINSFDFCKEDKDCAANKGNFHMSQTLNISEMVSRTQCLSAFHNMEAAGRNSGLDIGSSCTRDRECKSQICRSHMISGKNQCHSSDDRPFADCLVDQACASGKCNRTHGISLNGFGAMSEKSRELGVDFSIQLPSNSNEIVEDYNRNVATSFSISRYP
ncbi:2471_t:CDS:2 [Funneliformis geosporum]|nr:2471_t:CDS:2 [Funneliformis geosporum]